jgi:hypothetical protein
MRRQPMEILTVLRRAEARPSTATSAGREVPPTATERRASYMRRVPAVPPPVYRRTTFHRSSCAHRLCLRRSDLHVHT